jgi:hypothetical protein
MTFLSKKSSIIFFKYSRNVVFFKTNRSFLLNIDFFGQVGQKNLIRAGNTPQYLPRRRSQNVQISAAAAVASCFLDFFKSIIQHDFTCVNYGVENRYPLWEPDFFMYFLGRYLGTYYTVHIYEKLFYKTECFSLKIVIRGTCNGYYSTL